MIPTVNIEAKNILAKLLASENIWIQHRKVPTAYFDMVNRVLVFPMWKEMSDCLYTMLAGHEVGHALYSYDTIAVKEAEKKLGRKLKPNEKLNYLSDDYQRVNVDATVYAKRIDPKNLEVAGSYWNIVEDARIERLIKDPYPGLKSIFSQAYKELLDMNMFGIEGRDISLLPLIDRINLHFKIGHLISLHFTLHEEALVHKVAATKTMDDVIAVAKEIYDWSQENELQAPPPITIKMTMEEFKKCLEDRELEEDNGSGRGGQRINVEITDAENDDDGDENDKPGKSGKSKSKPKPKKDGDDKNGDKGKDKADKADKKQDKADQEKSKSDKDKTGEENGTDEGDGDDGDGDDGEDADDNGDNDLDDETTDEAGDDDGENAGTDSDPDKQTEKPKYVGRGRFAPAKPVNPGPPPDPKTQKIFDDKIKILQDPNAKEIIYVTLPKPNLKAILVDYETVHQGIRAHFASNGKLGVAAIEKAEKEYTTFCAAQMPIINYILQQFEMRKQAERYKRTRQHKTGALDTLRLPYYKTEEDLFKSIAICHDGKNHGLIFIVDWSGSMDSSMAGTLQQLIMLCVFCRKADIPFEVYSFTTGAGKQAFTQEPKNLEYASNFRMRMYLSSKMTPGAFRDACINLFALMPNGKWGNSAVPIPDRLIGCTPLDESIIASIDVMKEFRRKTGAQIVNTIFLTDGGANTVNSYFDESGRKVNIGRYNYYGNYGIQGDPNAHYIIDDRETHKVYEFEIGSMTPTMVRILRDRQNIHAVCFYIEGSWQEFFTSEIDGEKLSKEFAENGYVVSTEWGFNEMYITARGDYWKVKDVRLRPDARTAEPGTPEFLEEAHKNFVKNGRNMMKRRIMLDRFILMIC